MVDTHPWNTGFAWRDHDWPPTTLSAADVDRFDQRGYLVLASLFTAEEHLVGIPDAEFEAFRQRLD